MICAKAHLIKTIRSIMKYVKLFEDYLNENEKPLSVNSPKKKVYYEQHGIGNVKYTVNFFDGISKHKDGSDFYDIRTFSNKKKLNAFISELEKDGYVKK